MLTELDYRPDSAQVFQHLLDLPYCVFLDSGNGTPFAGRYDILAAAPYLTLTTRGEETEIRSRERIEVSRDDPLDVGITFDTSRLGTFAAELVVEFEGAIERRVPLSGTIHGFTLAWMNWSSSRARVGSSPTRGANGSVRSWPSCRSASPPWCVRKVAVHASGNGRATR